MAVFRFIALVLIVLGLMLLGADVITMLESRSEPHLRSLADVWAIFSPSGVAAFQAWLPDILPAPAAEGFATFLGLPAFAVLGAIGVVMAVLFRERDDLGEAGA